MHGTEQRSDDLERGFSVVAADESQQTLLDNGRKGILLGLVEAVHLSTNQDGAPAGDGERFLRPRTASLMSFTPENTAESAMKLRVRKHRP